MRTVGAATIDVGTDRPQAEDSLPRGALVGRYVVLDELGRGGMGIVYAAYDPELERRIALKVVGSRGRRADIGQMVAEAQALAKLHHPNVVSVHDVLSVDERVCIAMPYVEGATLREWLRVESRHWKDVLDVFLAAGDGLAAVHATGLVHRDLKPANLMVTREGRALLMDFGIALAKDGRAHAARSLASMELGDPERTASANRVGTPKYMSPEQWIDPDVDARSDQFSFCLCLYEALYDAPAYPRQDQSDRRWGELAPPPRRSRVPKGIWRALQRGLALRPDDRFESMEGLLARLRRAGRPATSRKLVVAAAIFVASAGVIAGVAGGEAPCSDVEDGLAGVWDPDVRQQVADVFGASELSYAEVGWRSVSQSVDRYSGQWMASRRDACEATHVRNEQSPALLDARMSCLNERRAELAALTKLLRAADSDLVTRAPALAGSLTPMDACNDLGALTAPVPLPASADAEQVKALQTALGEVRTLRGAHDLPGAKAKMEPILAASERIGYVPLRGEVLLELAALEIAEGDYPKAEGTLNEAAAAAVRGRHDELFARVAIRMTQFVGWRRARPDEGNSWAGLAEAGVVAAGERPDLRRALWSSVANLRRAEGEFTEARELIVRLHDDAKERFGEDDLRTIDSLSRLASAHQELGDFDQAIEAEQRVLQARKERLGELHPDTGSSHTGLGLALTTAGRGERGLEHLHRSLEITGLHRGENHTAYAHTLNNIGNTNVDLGRMVDARQAFTAAIEIWTAALGEADPRIGMARHNVGRTRFFEGDIAAAHRDFHAGLENMEAAVGPRSRYLAGALLGLASTTHAVGDDVASARHLERIVNGLDGGDALDGVRSRALRELGDLSRRSGDCDRASAYYEDAVPLDVDGLQRASIRAGQAACALATGQDGQALELIALAADGEARTEWRADPLPAALIALEHARILVATGQTGRGLELAESALERVREAGPRARPELEMWTGWLRSTQE